MRYLSTVALSVPKVDVLPQNEGGLEMPVVIVFDKEVGIPIYIRREVSRQSVGNERGGACSLYTSLQNMFSTASPSYNRSNFASKPVKD